MEKHDYTRVYIYICIHRIFGILLGYQGFIWEYGDLTSNMLRYDLMICNGEYNGILDVMECTVMWMSLEWWLGFGMIWVDIQNWPKFRFLNYYDLSRCWHSTTKHGSFNHKKGHLWYWNDNVRTILGVVTIIYCKGALTIKQGDVVDKWWSILLNIGGYTLMVYYRWDCESPQWGYRDTNGMTEGLEHCSDGFDLYTAHATTHRCCTWIMVEFHRWRCMMNWKTLADVTAQLSPFRKPSKSSRFSTQLGVLSWFIMIPSLVLGWFRLVVNSFAVSQVGSANRQLYAGSIPAYVIPMCPNLPWGSLPFFSGASVAKITQD